MAEGLPGRTFSLMAIEICLDFVSQVTPHVPAGGGVGDGTKDPVEVVGGLLGEHGERFRSIVGGAHRIARALQDRALQLAHHQSVVDDHD